MPQAPGRVRLDRRLLGWVGLALFALGCALMTALGGRQGGLASRYHACSVLWWVALVVVTLVTTAPAFGSARTASVPPNAVSFAATLPAAALPPGRHTLSLKVVTADSGVGAGVADPVGVAVAEAGVPRTGAEEPAPPARAERAERQDRADRPERRDRGDAEPDARQPEATPGAGRGTR